MILKFQREPEMGLCCHLIVLNIGGIKMKTLSIDYYRWMLMIVTLFASFLLAIPAVADQGYGMHHGAMHGGMGMYDGSGMYGASWKSTLTDEQRSKLAKLKLEHMQVVAPLIVKIKGVKAELAKLVTVDKPDMNAIKKKIDQLTSLKNEKLKSKYQYLIAKRKVLNAEQQVLFDLHVMKKALHSKSKGPCRH
jgi:Spy/CpxP family protein refolding chaperone